MQLEKLKYIYFIGIGGIGMSALARYFKRNGYNVAGYDKAKTTLTQSLENEGIDVNYNENIDWLISKIGTKTDTQIVFTPAIPNNHKELVYLQNQQFKIIKRAQALGIISKKQPTLAVAGTHGKTTTSTLLAHIINTNKPTIAFMGGIATNYNSNLLLPNQINETTPCVVEADEYDRSFLHLSPQYGIITSIDADHLDIYNSHNYLIDSYARFGGLVTGKLIVKKELQFLPSTKANTQTYSIIDSTADYFGSNIKINNGYFEFDFNSKQCTISNIQLGIPGNHNVENAVAALALAINYGITDIEKIKFALKSFTGIKRRFEFIVRSNSFSYIDDYAHHPTELVAIISSVKQLYPKQKITGIFQPHLYSRTQDFANDFSKSLSLLDQCILLPIYPARELPIAGVTSNILLENINSSYKIVCDKNEIISVLDKLKPSILLTLGAGDIDTLIPLLKEKYSHEK